MSSRARRLARKSSPPPAASVSRREPIGFLTVILVTAFAVTPLALATGVFLSHDVIPKLVLLTAAAALLLVFFHRWVAALQALWERRTGRIFLLLVAAQIASLAISTLLSGQIPLSLAGTLWRRFGLIGQSAVLVVAVAVASVVTSRPARAATLLRAVTACGGLAAAYGILQYFGVDPFLDRRLYAIDYFGGIVRPPATMGHALYFSAYLVPVLFMALAQAFGDTNAVWRRIHSLTALLAGVAIVLSATRSAMLAAAIGGLFFAWRAIGRSGRPALRFAGALLAIVAALAGFVVSPAGRNLRNRMAQWRSDLGGPRLEMWKECPDLIARHPLFGEGPDVFAGEFRQVQSAKLSRAYPDFYNETPHNALLDAACAQGIPGALILLGAIAITWFAGRRADFAANPLRAGLDAAMLGILISSTFASLTLVTSLYLWTTAGLVVALNPGEPVGETRPAWRLPAAALIVPGLALFLPGLMLAVQDAAWADMGRAVDSGNFAAARDDYSRAISASWGLPGYELWASREWATLGRALGKSPDAATAWKLASDAAARAEQNGEERFSAAYQASVLEVAQANLAGAESQAREAIRLAPNWYKAHLLRSQILRFMGKDQEAAREAGVSASLGWRQQP